MAIAVSTTRRFRVHARHVDSHHARLLHEPTFEAAAIAYAEDLAVGPDEAEGEVSLIVRDMDSGHEHCFRLDLRTGETSSCG